MSPGLYLAKSKRALASASLLLADYTGEAIDATQARWAIEQATEFLSRIEVSLSSNR